MRLNHWNNTRNVFPDLENHVKVVSFMILPFLVFYVILKITLNIHFWMPSWIKKMLPQEFYGTFQRVFRGHLSIFSEIFSFLHFSMSSLMLMDYAFSSPTPEIPGLSIKLPLGWCREVNLTSNYLNNIRITFYNYKNPVKVGLFMILAIFVFS